MSFLSSLANLGLGYSIAITLGFLVLLASYFCFRRGGGGDYWAGEAATTASSSGHISITVPRVLFIAKGSESPDATYSSSSAAAAAACYLVGLDPAAIVSYPKVPFSSRVGEADAMCSICLSGRAMGQQASNTKASTLLGQEGFAKNDQKVMWLQLGLQSVMGRPHYRLPNGERMSGRRSMSTVHEIHALAVPT
ncbi:hypothetical protein BAE44_0020217 [Dichanthelium oligosanthes]|uniref:Uncharacterized protein n=1 Tax=Dichanthelium oligosanthes TaxID=888268 RepID=A0A1E5V141_9POAL|nr:hypothetical protein BAE44_0020217 [Dichanthelium oligosanthes]